MRRICVFSGSNPGNRLAYIESARALGRMLAERGITLVYGGAGIGLMGVLARAVLDARGEVIGVIPHMLVEKEVALKELTSLRIVNSMHERKSLMAELADGFVAIPGGIGTLEEFFEVWTWAQLGLHAKPCGLLNVAGYFDPLLQFLDGTVSEGFVKQEHRSMLIVEEEPAKLLTGFETYKPPQVEKWIGLPHQT